METAAGTNASFANAEMYTKKAAIKMKKGAPVSLHPKVMLTAEERRHFRVLQHVCGHLSWEDRHDPYIGERMSANFRSICDLVENAFRRAIGLEVHMIVRVTSAYMEPVTFQIQGFSASAIRGPHYVTAGVWELYGNPLLKDGTPSFHRYAQVQFTQARIERRCLDGSWSVIVDTLGKKNNASCA